MDNFDMNLYEICQTDAYKKEWEEFEDVDDSDGWEGFDEPSHIPPSMQEKKIVQADEIFLVNKLNDNFCTTSRIVAKALEKKHKAVLEKIRYLLSCVRINQRLTYHEKMNIINQFQETTYTDEQNRQRIEYHIKCEGFIQLVDSFCVGGERNERVLAWRVQLNKRYFEMERQLKKKEADAKKDNSNKTQLKMVDMVETVNLAKNIYNFFGGKKSKGEIFYNIMNMVEKNYNVDTTEIKDMIIKNDLI